MDGKKSFKERIKEAAIINAKEYKRYFVDYEYLVCSDAFQKSPFYIIQSHEDNYKHLLGISSAIGAGEFFEKCMDGTLSEEDFSFVKQGQDENSVKGSVRRKINTLPYIMNLFSNKLEVEEDFEKNRIKCSFAVAGKEFTLGFTSSFPSKPMTLLKGKQLEENKSAAAKLVLRRNTGDEKFSEIIVGDVNELRSRYSQLSAFLTNDLLQETKGFMTNDAGDEPAGS